MLFRSEDAKALSQPMYETFKNVVNEDFTYEFSHSKSKALLCWGSDDTATPLSSGEKIHSLMEDSKLKIYDGDHYFFMKKAEDISQEIEDTFLSTLGQ